MKCQHVCDAGPSKGTVCVRKPNHKGPHMDAGKHIEGSKRGVIYKVWEDVFVPFVPDPREKSYLEPSTRSQEAILSEIAKDRARVDAIAAAKRAKKA